MSVRDHGKRQRCEIWSRVVGYLRPVDQWNDGKKEEFAIRQRYTGRQWKNPSVTVPKHFSPDSSESDTVMRSKGEKPLSLKSEIPTVAPSGAARRKGRSPLSPTTNNKKEASP